MPKNPVTYSKDLRDGLAKHDENKHFVTIDVFRNRGKGHRVTAQIGADEETSEAITDIVAWLFGGTIQPATIALLKKKRRKTNG